MGCECLQKFPARLPLYYMPNVGTTTDHCTSQMLLCCDLAVEAATGSMTRYSGAGAGERGTVAGVRGSVPLAWCM